MQQSAGKSSCAECIIRENFQLTQDVFGGATPLIGEFHFNATAPNPSTNAALTRALGSALGRPTPFPVPAAALRLAIGGAARVVTGGQPAIPERLTACDHSFRHVDIESAIQAVLDTPVETD